MKDKIANNDEIIEIEQQWQKYHEQLLDRCIKRTDNYEWSRLSKLPLKVINILQPMTWRMRDAEEAARMLIENNYVHPSAILIRSAMENTAFVHMLSVVVKEVVDAGEVQDDTDEQLMNLSFGNQYKRGVFIPDEVFESMHEHKAIRSGKLLKEIDKLYPSYNDMYSSLCEFVHANTDGVQGCFSDLNIKKHTTYYGKMLTKESSIFPAIESSVVVALAIYNERYDAIMNMMPDFIKICEEDIHRKRRVIKVEVEQ